MKKLILAMLILVLTLTLAFTAIASPTQVATVKAPPDIGIDTESDQDTVEIQLSKLDTSAIEYHIYYAPYDQGDNRTDNPKWLMQNGKLISKGIYGKPNSFKRINLGINGKIAFTITIVDKNGNESEPTSPLLAFTKYTNTW